MTQEPHPDELADWRAFKQITHGSRQAIDDEAIAAYLKVYNETKDEKQADEAHSLVYKKYYGDGK